MSIPVSDNYPQTHRWGDKIIQRLATDLKAAFPDMKGFSPSNLKYMRYFAEQCPSCQIGQQAADQLPMNKRYLNGNGGGNE